MLSHFSRFSRSSGNPVLILLSIILLQMKQLVMRGTYDNCGSISSDEGMFLPWSACVVSHGAVGDRSG